MDGSPELGRFAEVVARDDFPLDHAAMLIGAWDYPERDLAAYRDQLDSMASYAQGEVTRATGGIGRARAISDCLFDRLGFCGNVGDYYDPRNSFLCDVIDRRTGIPISLSVLYLEVSRRVGVLSQGVNFPGHFLVRVAIEDAWLFLDPYSGGRALTPVDLDWTIAGSLLALGVLGTGLAYIWNINVLRAWGPTGTSTVTYVTPVVGVALGVLLLGERFSWHEPLGAALVLLGILLAQGRLRLGGRKRAEADASAAA